MNESFDRIPSASAKPSFGFQRRTGEIDDAVGVRVLSTKGLRLGQYASERPIAEPFEPEPLSADEQARSPGRSPS